MWIINDFLAYGNLSKYMNKDYNVCPVCGDSLCGTQLDNFNKIIYMVHWGWLPRGHNFHRQHKFLMVIRKMN